MHDVLVLSRWLYPADFLADVADTPRL